MKLMCAALKAVLGSLVALLLLGAGAVAYLGVPGTPSDAKSLVFKGYVLLPPGKSLTVLDYLSIYGENLFVTNESSGSVYRVALRPGALPGEADVSIFAG